MVESVASDNVSSTTAVGIGIGIDVEVGITTGVGVITTLLFAAMLRRSI